MIARHTCFQLRSNKETFCLLVAALTLGMSVLFRVLFSAAFVSCSFVVFLCALMLVIFLLKMAQPRADMLSTVPLCKEAMMC